MAIMKESSTSHAGEKTSRTNHYEHTHSLVYAHVHNIIYYQEYSDVILCNADVSV